MSSKSEGDLEARIREIERDAGASSVAVAIHDYETGRDWSVGGDEWFHAASTIKVPVLVGVMGAAERGVVSLESRVHVRNRFLSVATGEAFRVSTSRDANAAVHEAIGRTMKVRDLAYHMIVTSSNLATNLLIRAVGLEELQARLRQLEVRGVELRRGVEDEAAWEAGINNRVTAHGLREVLRMIEEGRAFSVEASAAALEILHDQEFRSGIPAGVPDHVRVANKTGEISTIAHDCAVVYPRDRKPYALVVLTAWDADRTGRRSETIARISRAVYAALVGPVDEGEEDEDG